MVPRVPYKKYLIYKGKEYITHPYIRAYRLYGSFGTLEPWNPPKKESEEQYEKNRSLKRLHQALS